MGVFFEGGSAPARFARPGFVVDRRGGLAEFLADKAKVDALATKIQEFDTTRKFPWTKNTASRSWCTAKGSQTPRTISLPAAFQRGIPSACRSA